MGAPSRSVPADADAFVVDKADVAEADRHGQQCRPVNLARHLFEFPAAGRARRR